jgi:hypothetical protein
MSKYICLSSINFIEKMNDVTKNLNKNEIEKGERTLT